MTSSGRPSPEPLLKKEASPDVLRGRNCSGSLKCLELEGLGDPSRTLDGNSRKRSESVSGVFPEFLPESPSRTRGMAHSAGPDEKIERDSGEKKAHKQQKILGTPTGCAWDTRQDLPAGVPGISVVCYRKVGSCSGCVQKRYAIFSHVPFSAPQRSSFSAMAMPVKLGIKSRGVILNPKPIKTYDVRDLGMCSVTGCSPVVLPFICWEGGLIWTFIFLHCFCHFLMKTYYHQLLHLQFEMPEIYLRSGQDL